MVRTVALHHVARWLAEDAVAPSEMARIRSQPDAQQVAESCAARATDWLASAKKEPNCEGFIFQPSTFGLAAKYPPEALSLRMGANACVSSEALRLGLAAIGARLSISPHAPLRVASSLPLQAVPFVEDGFYRWTPRMLAPAVVGFTTSGDPIWQGIGTGDIVRLPSDYRSKPRALADYAFDVHLKRLKRSGRVPEWVPARSSAVFFGDAAVMRRWENKLNGRDLLVRVALDRPERVAICDARAYDKMHDVAFAVGGRGTIECVTLSEIKRAVRESSAIAERYWCAMLVGDRYDVSRAPDDALVEYLTDQPVRTLGSTALGSMTPMNPPS